METIDNRVRMIEACNVLVSDSLTHKESILISARLMESVYQLMQDDSKKDENSKYIIQEIEYLRRNAEIVRD